MDHMHAYHTHHISHGHSTYISHALISNHISHVYRSCISYSYTSHAPTAYIHTTYHHISNGCGIYILHDHMSHMLNTHISHRHRMHTSHKHIIYIYVKHIPHISHTHHMYIYQGCTPQTHTHWHTCVCIWRVVVLKGNGRQISKVPMDKVGTIWAISGIALDFNRVRNQYPQLYTDIKEWLNE